MDVKKATRKLKLTKYMENFYYILCSPLPEKSLLRFAGKLKTKWPDRSNRSTRFTVP